MGRKVSFAGLALVPVIAAGDAPLTVPAAVEKSRHLEATEWGDAHADALVHGDIGAQISREVWAPGELVLCTGAKEEEGDRTYMIGVLRSADGGFSRQKLVASPKYANVHDFVRVPRVSG